MSTIKKYIVLGVLLGLFLVVSVSINHVKAETITVPNEYPTIQDAVNHAKAKDTIVLSSGTYNETVVVDKGLTINGQSRYNTIIEGLNASGSVEIDLKGVCVNRVDAQNSVSIWLSGSRFVDANIGSNAKVYMTNSDILHPQVSDNGQILFFGNFLIIGRLVFSLFDFALFVVLLSAISIITPLGLIYHYRKRKTSEQTLKKKPRKENCNKDEET
jgi:hypothetical protein